MGSHSFTCHPTEVILTPLPPAYAGTSDLLLTLLTGRYSFIDP